MAIDNDTLKIIVPAICTAVASIIANIVQYRMFKGNKAAERETKIIESYNDFYIKLLNELSVINTEYKTIKRHNKKINSYKTFGAFLCNDDKGDTAEDACKDKCSVAFNNILESIKSGKYYPLNNKINTKLLNLMFYIQYKDNHNGSSIEIRLTNIKRLHKAIFKQLKKLG